MSKNTSWISPKLEKGVSMKHGNGIFVKQDIKQKERVAIFGGDIMLIDEIDNLPVDLQEYPIQIEERFVLGSRDWADLEDADCFNHSCDPNAGLNGQIFLVAMRDIKKGEEVTFDYSMAVSKSVGSNTVFEMDCNCGSKNCRKKITEEDWKLPEIRRKYNGYFSQYIQEKINQEKENEIK